MKEYQELVNYVKKKAEGQIFWTFGAQQTVPKALLKSVDLTRNIRKLPRLSEQCEAELRKDEVE